jgi:hypothetical protein
VLTLSLIFPDLKPENVLVYIDNVELIISTELAAMSVVHVSTKASGSATPRPYPLSGNQTPRYRVGGTQTPRQKVISIVKSTNLQPDKSSGNQEAGNESMSVKVADIRNGMPSGLGGIFPILIFSTNNQPDASSGNPETGDEDISAKVADVGNGAPSGPGAISPIFISSTRRISGKP